MKKIIIGTILLLLLFFVWLQKNYNNTSDTDFINNKPIVKIGVIMPLSGDNAVLGLDMKEGLEFLKSSQKYQISYEIIYEDDQMKSAKTIVAANKLINVDKVDVILTYGSQPAAVVAPVSSQAKILHLASSSDTAFTKLPYNYAFAPLPKKEVRMMLQNIQKQGYKKIALISAPETYSSLIDGFVKQLAADYGLEIVFSSTINFQDRDFKMLIAEAETHKPDIYITQIWEPQLDIFIKQLRQKNPHSTYTATYNFLLSPNPQLFENQYTLNLGTSSKKFQEDFYKIYNHYPPQNASVAFGAVDLLLKTLAKTNSLKDEKKFLTSLQETINENTNILGSLVLEEKQITFAPILQKFINGKTITVEQ